MQLKKSPSLRLALATATSALLMEPCAHALEQGSWDTSVGSLFYKEKKRVSIIEPVMLTTYRYNEEDSISLRVVVDSMSGASPTGASVSSVQQSIPVTITSASGSAQPDVTVPAGTQPTNEFSDFRMAFSANWQKAYTRTIRSVLGGNISREHDYHSLGANATLLMDTEDKLTTFTLAFAHTRDTIDPIGGAPDALTKLVALGNVNPEDHSTHTGEQHEAITAPEGPKEHKTINDVLIGVTQVLTPRWLMQLNYSLGHSNGYLNDPYKIISRVNPATGLTFDYWYENRPDTRLRHVVYLKSVMRLTDDVVHLSYRYYRDDWDIQAHTVEAKYRYNLNEQVYLMPSFRYYRQSGAEFFHYSLLNDASNMPAYASADLRLAPMQSTTTGLKVGFLDKKGLELSFRGEYMQQWGEDNPKGAVGTQKKLELFPKLEVIMITLEATYLY